MFKIALKIFLRNMFRLRWIINLDKRALLCVVSVLSVVILVDINTRSHLLYKHIYNATGNDTTKLTDKQSFFAVFLLLTSNNSLSLETGQPSKAGHFENSYFKIGLPDCDTTRSFNLYLLRYTPDPGLASKESFTSYLNEKYNKCRRYVPTVVEDFLITDPAVDGRFLRDVIRDAYLDNADYYDIVLFDGIAEDSKTEVDLSHWKDILLQRSPHGVGVVATLNSGAISKLFFSKIHIDIFGAAFPVRISKLESALSYVVKMYNSNRLATIADGKKNGMASSDGEVSSTEWTEQLTGDNDTLNRYLSAVKASNGTWRSISSSRNVIAMSLYGDRRRYTMGALRNAQLLPVILPGWHLWFYCEKPDSDGTVKHGKVPARILRKIAELGAEIRYVNVAATRLAPMLWRFLVAEDLDVEAFAVRDCDSRLTLRDATVIGEWLKTNASFHCIRDHPSHSNYPVSGGMWGGRPRELYSILNGTMRSVMTRYGAGYLADMNFLGANVWPKVKDAAFCHDSFSCQKYPSSHPFPVKRIGYEHLGQVYDENSVGRQGDINILASAAVNAQCVPTT